MRINIYLTESSVQILFLTQKYLYRYHVKLQSILMLKKNQGLNHPKMIELGAILFLGLIALFLNSRMIRDGVNGLGDLFWHLTRVQHFSQQIAKGIMYPRWIAGTNYRKVNKLCILSSSRLLYWFGV